MAEPKAKSWILRCKVGHKRREIGMGAFPDVTLSAARDRARDGRDLIRKGIDPVEAHIGANRVPETKPNFLRGNGKISGRKIG